MADILIVDDNEITVRSFDHLLSKEGYNVIPANSGVEAIRLLEHFNFDLVVADLIMPFINGLELVRHIKGTTGREHVPIIVISSLKDEKSKMECYTIGVDIYLAKPINPLELVMMVKKLLSRQLPNVLAIELRSTITCPNCGHRKEETMPIDAYQYNYKCESCHRKIKPKEGDCCVFCSYGTVKCPAIQKGTNCS